MNHKKGFTLVELLVVIAIIALLIGLLLPALAKARANAQSLKDKTQVTQIHKAALGFATENKGKLPIPGLINRLADPNLANQQIAGQGPEDQAQNTTPNLFSAMIAQNLFQPEIVMGPTEFRPVFKVDTDYNHAEYQPAADKYWDTGFHADPQVAAATDECNASYAHTALIGQRKKSEWKDTQRQAFACFGTRGTGGGAGGFGGALTGSAYEQSPTLELHLPKKVWVGNVVFADNHAETVTNFYTGTCGYSPKSQQGQTSILGMAKDHIYSPEFTDFGAALLSGDSYLGMFSVAAANGLSVTPRFDPENQ
jgi:prepilin-type N-terminal cleavage/methylation domain-containing protein